MTDQTANAARENALKQIAQAQGLIEQIQGKMRGIVDEFARGEISREQFHKIYEHYQSQIVMAAQMAAEADLLGGEQLAPGQTFAIRSKLMAKAQAMTIFYHATGLLLETLGDFDISMAKISPTLGNISAQVQAGTRVNTRSEKFGNLWLLYVPGTYTTALMLFSNEPAGRQIGIIENMHHDFEKANETALKGGNADATKLVYPFQAFVRRSVGK